MPEYRVQVTYTHTEEANIKAGNPNFALKMAYKAARPEWWPENVPLYSTYTYVYDTAGNLQKFCDNCGIHVPEGEGHTHEQCDEIECEEVLFCTKCAIEQGYVDDPEEDEENEEEG